MESSKHIEAVIWDMDGTMFDTERLQIECWEQACNEHGYTNVQSTLMKMIGRTRPDSLAILASDLGPDFPVQKVRERKNTLRDERLLKNGLPLKKGLTDVLHFLKQHNVPNAIASSTDRPKILQHLQHAGLTDFFVHVVGGDQVRRGKPDPEIFLTTAADMGVKAEHCAAMEDSYNGVKAAYDAGMHVIMIPDLVQPTEDILLRVHNKLESLLEAVIVLKQLLKHPA